MWNALVRRRSRGYEEEEEHEMRMKKSQSGSQYIELTNEDCKFLSAAGLKIQQGVNPRDLYCLEYLPSYYDGTPLQVLRLLEEVRTAGRAMARAQTEAAKRHASLLDQGRSAMRWNKTQKTLNMDMELLDESDSNSPEMIQIAPSFSSSSSYSSKRLSSSPVKTTTGGYTYNASSSSPVKSGQSQAATPVRRASKRTSMTVEVVSMENDPTATKKRKSESLSPLAALFSPTSNIQTPSPGLKTRRSSVLKQFETPESRTSIVATPPTVGAPPPKQQQQRYSVTKTITTHEWSLEKDDDDASADELADDDDQVDDDSRGCCEGVPSVVEPIWDAFQRTSTRFQNAWEEVRGLSSCLVLVPVSSCSSSSSPSKEMEMGMEDHGDDDDGYSYSSRFPSVADVRGAAVDFLLVCQSDPDSQEYGQDQTDQGMTKSGGGGGGGGTGLSVRTRRQQQEIRRRLSAAATPWRLW